MAARQTDYLKTLPQVLTPVRQTLHRQTLLGGDTPNYSDDGLFGSFMWGRWVSDLALAIHAWRERLLDPFAGMTRQATIFSQAQSSAGSVA